ncbi:hypothetical protein Mal4_40160 [Maioricimonas rarisocia]|uniref:Uncharacterized protein n=1 Tax=Maioricimonas rarisocia TaxID=2528026 RepID=A0A517ZB63_9PLAN|nr:hypothetical protein [Maioricimonas rarisocia]QDU39670.1 hypothetical protein Mal4_40160 [Maioricimonas rarisocia]
MSNFTDRTGRTWQVDVNVAAVKRVRDTLGINLLAVLDDGARLLADLHDDPILLVDVLYVICRPEAETAGVDDEAFGRAMSGDALLAAHAALIEGLEGFFPNPGQRAVLKTLVGKIRGAAEALMEHAETTLQEIDEASVAQHAIASAGSSRASSASSPGR